VGTTTVNPISSTVPVVSSVCAQISTSNLDTAWRAYDAAIDAVNLLLDAKVITPGSAKANAIADANDAVLKAFQTAEHAKALCDATSYTSALDSAKASVVDLRAALGSK
jgi:hypothetical protein